MKKRPKFSYSGGGFPEGSALNVRLPDGAAAEELRRSFDAEAQRRAGAAGEPAPPPVTVRRKGK